MARPGFPSLLPRPQSSLTTHLPKPHHLWISKEAAPKASECLLLYHFPTMSLSWTVKSRKSLWWWMRIDPTSFEFRKRENACLKSVYYLTQGGSIFNATLSHFSIEKWKQKRKENTDFERFGYPSVNTSIADLLCPSAKFIHTEVL